MLIADGILSRERSLCAVPSRDPQGGRRTRGRLRSRLPRRLDAHAGREDHARLLWYANHAHGSGASYNVVTITGIADGAAWESLALRVPERRSGAVATRAGQPAARRDGQDLAAGRVVTASGGGPGERADRRGDAPAESLHGGHRLAILLHWTTTSACGTRSTTGHFR